MTDLPGGRLRALALPDELTVTNGLRDELVTILEAPASAPERAQRVLGSMVAVVAELERQLVDLRDQVQSEFDTFD